MNDATPKSAWSKKTKLIISCGVGLIVLVAAYALLKTNAAGPVLFSDDFNGYSDGLITSEYTYWNPNSSSAKQNPNWEMTSGSLFASQQQGYTGVPTFVSGDAVANPTTTSNNNSSVFRLTSKRSDFGNVKVGFRLFMKQQLTTSGTPAVAWDGVHIFLRYQSEYNLYYASVNRRDGHVVIKKKCVGGSENGGTYYTLNSEVPNHPIPFNKWQDVAASVKNNADGSVTIELYRDGVLVHQATDNGVGCQAITAPGKTGIRGDNSEFLFDDFTVEALESNNTADTQAPTISITKPSAGATLSGQTDLTVTANDNTGISKVEYWLDGKLLNATSAAPYSYQLATSLYANGGHSLTAKAFDAAGNVGTSSVVNFTIQNNTADTQAPTVPTNLKVTNQGATSLGLGWTASTDNVKVAGYNLYRNGDKVASPTGTTYTDSNLQAGTPYNYTVEAYDAAGNISPRSQAVSTVTLPNSSGGIAATVKITDDWGSGYCAEVQVINSGSTAVTSWKTSFTTSGKVKSLWNANWTQSGTTVTISNSKWNGNLAPGQTLTGVGFCARR